jgi:hypothetical protein
LGEIFSHNLPIAAECLLLLPGGDFLGLTGGAGTLFVALHLVGLAVAATAIGLGGWQFGRRQANPAGGLTGQLLVAGILINFAAFVATAHVFDVASAREIAPVLPFAAALAGRELGPYLGAARVRGERRRGRWLRPAGDAALGLVLAGYLAGLGLELTAPAAPPQDAQLTAWLESHPIGAGLSGYYPGFGDRQAVVATFGKPGRVYQVGQYTILWWPKNLLTDLR